VEFQGSLVEKRWVRVEEGRVNGVASVLVTYVIIRKLMIRAFRNEIIQLSLCTC